MIKTIKISSRYTPAAQPHPPLGYHCLCLHIKPLIKLIEFILIVVSELTDDRCPGHKWHSVENICPQPSCM